MAGPSSALRRAVHGLVSLLMLSALLATPYLHAAMPETIERVKPSIVAIGSYSKTRSPPFSFRGTGFVVGDGTLIATNAHVLPDSSGPDGISDAPISLPTANARQLDEKAVRSLRSGTFAVYQLDATAYSGNSGSPRYDPESGRVVGIVNTVFVKGTRASAINHPSDITFAIPARFLRDLLVSVR